MRKYGKCRNFYLGSFFGLFFFSFVSHAQNSASVQTTVKSAAAEQDFTPLLKFDLVGLNYLSDSQYDSTSQQKAQAEIGFQKKGPFFSKVQALAGTFSEPNSSYFAVPEINMGYGNRDLNFISVGRQIDSFSSIDSTYHLGLFNPYFSNDLIDYTEQGLTGVHAQIYNGFVGLQVGWNPFFFPNQGPQVHEENGQISSSNRWAPRPPPKFQFAEQNRSIQYVIRDYKINEIIENQGQTAKVFLGTQASRPWVQISYANKPLNEIPLSRDTYGTAIDFKGHVDLSPVVTRHEVKAIDLNFDVGYLKSTLSYLEDQPQNKIAPETETLQYLNPMKIYGVSIAADLQKFFKRDFLISISVADIRGGEIKDLDRNGQESLFTFSTERAQFRRPVTLGLSSELFFIGSKALHSDFRWTYDQAYKGTLVSALFKYPAFEKMNLNLGFDLIGVENEIPSDQPGNYLNDNKANDRVYGGLQYAF